MNKFDAPHVPRRVITGVRDGKSVLLSDGPVSNAHHYLSIPGMMTSVIYATAQDFRLPFTGSEPAYPGVSAYPAVGETRLMIVTFPPDSSLADGRFDPVAADSEQRRYIPGLAETFEPDAPGFHRTATLDYDMVLEGEIWLEVDDGEQTCLSQGDVVVQCGARHAWRNRSQQTTTMCFVLMGVEQRGE